MSEYSSLDSILCEINQPLCERVGIPEKLYYNTRVDGVVGLTIDYCVYLDHDANDGVSKTFEGFRTVGRQESRTVSKNVRSGLATVRTVTK